MIDIGACKKIGGINLALTYAINKRKQKLEELPKDAMFQRDTLENEIATYERILEKRRKQKWLV